MEVSGSDDEFLTVLAKFRHTLLGIPLPPPAPVDYEQALKDAQRESIQVTVAPAPVGGREDGRGRLLLSCSVTRSYNSVGREGECCDARVTGSIKRRQAGRESVVMFGDKILL